MGGVFTKRNFFIIVFMSTPDVCFCTLGRVRNIIIAVLRYFTGIFFLVLPISGSFIPGKFPPFFGRSRVYMNRNKQVASAFIREISAGMQVGINISGAGKKYFSIGQFFLQQITQFQTNSQAYIFFFGKTSLSPSIAAPVSGVNDDGAQRIGPVGR